MLKQISVGLILSGLIAALPAFACTCAPFEGTASEHAETYDFVGVVKVGEVFELRSEAADADAFAYQSFLSAQSETLYDFAEAQEAGVATGTLEETMDEFYANSDYQPAPYQVSTTLTQMLVQTRLKGEDQSVIFVRSNSPGMPACGVSYAPDTEILLLATGGNGVYSTNMCSHPRFSTEDYEAALTTD